MDSCRTAPPARKSCGPPPCRPRLSHARAGISAHEEAEFRPAPGNCGSRASGSECADELIMDALRKDFAGPRLHTPLPWSADAHSAFRPFIRLLIHGVDLSRRLQKRIVDAPVIWLRPARAPVHRQVARHLGRVFAERVDNGVGILSDLLEVDQRGHYRHSPSKSSRLFNGTLLCQALYSGARPRWSAGGSQLPQCGWEQVATSVLNASGRGRVGGRSGEFALDAGFLKELVGSVTAGLDFGEGRPAAVVVDQAGVLGMAARTSLARARRGRLPRLALREFPEC